MKDKGTLFKPDMAKAADEGRKTQTRRIMKVQPPGDGYQLITCISTTSDKRYEGKSHWAKVDGLNIIDDHGQYFTPPYAIGQRLYLKETHYRHGYWVRNGKTKTGKRAWCFVGSTKPEEWLFEPPDFARVEQDSYHTIGWYKRSKLFMPKRFARRWYVVTAVRAERLQDISDEDAQDEGIPNTYRDGVCRWRYLTREDAGCNNPIGPFKELWESIHGPGSWGRNPYVWCICFQKSKKEVG